MISPIKFSFTCCAVIALTFCCAPDVDAQGFRIGNFMQAGGGQGFRLGNDRVGMHFGGGQGTSIGTQRFGMRFGNGQGARIGGASLGMQFGGGQGTQIGQLNTTTSGAPGTYYYGDVQNNGYNARPKTQGPIVQYGSQPSIVGQPVIQPQPRVSRLNSGPVVQPRPGISSEMSKAAPTPSSNATQLDIARQPATTGQPTAAAQPAAETVQKPEPVVDPAVAKQPTGHSVLVIEPAEETPVVTKPKSDK